MDKNLDKISDALSALVDKFEEETGEKCLISFSCTDGESLKQTTSFSEGLEYDTSCMMIVGLASAMSNGEKNR